MIMDIINKKIQNLQINNNIISNFIFIILFKHEFFNQLQSTLAIIILDITITYLYYSNSMIIGLHIQSAKLKSRKIFNQFISAEGERVT